MSLQLKKFINGGEKSSKTRDNLQTERIYLCFKVFIAFSMYLHTKTVSKIWKIFVSIREGVK